MSIQTSMAGNTTLASWTFTEDVARVWFNQGGAPSISPTTCVGDASNYNLTAYSKDRYWEVCTGYNNKVLRIENADRPNNITDFADGTQHNVYYEISFPTLNYKDIEVNFAYAYGANAAAPMKIVVSTDNGNTWVIAGEKTPAANWWIYNDNNVSISVQNKEKVIVRLVAANGYASNWNLNYINVTGTYAETFKTTYPLSVSTNIAGAGSIAVSPSGSEFEEGTEVTLSTTPNFGYRFLNWTDGDNNVVGTSVNYTTTMDKSKTFVANYEVKNTYALSYSIQGVSSNHLVSVAPTPVVVDGKNMYEEGTIVKLTASDNEVISFLSWNDGESTDKTYTFTMNGDKDVVASYTASDYIVAWDLYEQSPKQSRVGDFYSSDDNKGELILTKDGTTSVGWLSHTGWVGHPCAISWQNINDKYYFQWNFSTTGKKNIKVKMTASAINYSRYTAYDVEYSTDNTTWNKLGAYDFSTNTSWETQTFELPEAANNKEKVYVRMHPAADATITGSGNDCAAVTNIFVTYDNGVDENDKTAPVLTATTPQNDGTASTSGNIIITFDETVALASNAAGTLDGETIQPTVSGNSVFFAYSALEFSTPYTFTLPAGSVTDASGNVYNEAISINFTTADRPQPAARLYDAVVAADGSGDYTSVQEAINAAPSNQGSPYLIFIKAGVYKEHVSIPKEKPYIHLIGEDRNLVSIEDKKLCGALGNITPSSSDVYELKSDGSNFNVQEGATVDAFSNDLYFEGINLVNSYGRDEKNGPQALALFADGDRVIFNKCGLISYQDTYLTAYNNSAYRQYVKDSWIEGAVDFIYGQGDIYFDGDTINIVRDKGGYIVAPCHTKQSKWGYVFDNNVITSTLTDNPKDVACYFGRPWSAYPITVFLHTTCEISTYEGIWYEKMGGIPQLWAVYDMKDKEGNAMSTASRSYYYYTDRNTNELVEGYAKNSLTDEEAAQYSIKNVLRGNDAWQPELICQATAAPEISVTEGKISWEAVPYAICYVVLKDGKAYDFTTSTSYTIDDANATYTVKAANEFGGLSAASKSVSNGIETGVGTVTAQNEVGTSNVSYNLAGQRVADSFKGIIVSGGKKYVK